MINNDKSRKLPWPTIKGGLLMRKEFKFKDFNEAWSFMSDVAEVADQLDHHPEWSNTYNNVEIILTTHDAGEITDLDIELANNIDSIEKKYK